MQYLSATEACEFAESIGTVDNRMSRRLGISQHEVAVYTHKQ